MFYALELGGRYKYSFDYHNQSGYTIYGFKDWYARCCWINEMPLYRLEVEDDIPFDDSYDHTLCRSVFPRDVAVIIEAEDDE